MYMYMYVVHSIVHCMFDLFLLIQYSVRLLCSLCVSVVPITCNNKHNPIQAAVKIMAKDLVRTRNHIKKFYLMRANIQAISLKLQVRTTCENLISPATVLCKI